MVPLDQHAALAIGKACRRTGADDVVDVSVACARERSQRVVTSDPDDLHSTGPTLPRYL